MSSGGHFAAVADDYARYRPGYPPALFADLATLAPARHLACDCAAGSGQASVPLAQHFSRVVACDLGAQPLAMLPSTAGVERVVARAECLPLRAACVDLITVAQALHWFDVTAFVAEARRVLRPGGVLAAWTYGLCRVGAAVDALLDGLYHDTLAGCWPPERRLVEEGYRGVPLPGRERRLRAHAMTARWRRDDFLGYLATWSAGGGGGAPPPPPRRDPLVDFAARLALVWPDDGPREVRWPLALRVVVVD